MVSILGRGEVKHSDGESTKPVSEQRSFQAQQSPGAKLMESSSRYLFVALFWSSAWLWSTEPGDILKVRPIQRAVKLGYTHERSLYKCTRKGPPDSNSSSTTTQSLKPFELTLIMWRNSKHIHGGAIETSKQTWAAWLPLWERLSSGDRAKERKEKEKSTTDETEVIRSWKWLIENNGWRRWLDEWLTDWTGGLSDWVRASVCWQLRPFGGRAMAD